MWKKEDGQWEMSKPMTIKQYKQVIVLLGSMLIIISVFNIIDDVIIHPWQHENGLIQETEYQSPFTEEEEKEAMKFRYSNPDPSVICDGLNDGSILIEDIPIAVRWIEKAC